MLTYPSQQTQNRLRVHESKEPMEEWRNLFGYIFKNIFPLPEDLYEDIWKLIHPHLADIAFNTNDRANQTLQAKKS